MTERQELTEFERGLIIGLLLNIRIKKGFDSFAFAKAVSSVAPILFH